MLPLDKENQVISALTYSHLSKRKAHNSCIFRPLCNIIGCVGRLNTHLLEVFHHRLFVNLDSLLY